MIIERERAQGTALVGRRSAPSDWSARMLAVADSFTGLYASSENTFLAVGEQLQRAHETLQTVSNMSGAVADQLTDAKFQALLEDLDGAASQVERLRHGRGDLGRALDDITTATTEIMAPLAEISATMSRVRVLAVNARIEAAGIGGAAADFVVFTSEVERLARTGGTTVTEVKNQLDALKRVAAGTRQLWKEFDKSSMTELAAVAGRLTRSIAVLRTRRERAIEAVRDLPGTIQEVAACVARVVEDLQIDDITRQRLQHVEHGLRVVGEALAQDEATLSPEHARVLTNGACELERLQLEQAMGAYREAVARVGRNLPALAAAVPRLRAICVHVFEATEGRESSFVLAVNRELAAASGLVGHYLATTTETTAALGQLGTAAASAGRLLGSLASVETELRMAGLNAALKCGRMGTQGRVLKAIAEQLQAQAKSTQPRFATVNKHLESLRGAAARVDTAELAESGVAVTALRERLDARASELGTIGEDAARLFEEFQRESAALEGIVHAAVAAFSSDALSTEVADAAKRELLALGRESNPGLSGGALEAARRDALSFMEGRYTMASERDVHRRALGKDLADMFRPGAGAPAHVSVAAAEAKAPDLSDILF